MTNGDSCANSVALSGPVSNAGTLDVEDPQGGARSIDGNLVNKKIVSLAAGAALHVTGNYTQTHNGEIETSIAGPSSSGSFGSLSVAGAAKLEEGTLILKQTPAFRASLGETFAILANASMTGAFAKETGAQVLGGSAGLYYKPTYSATGVTLIVTKATRWDSPGRVDYPARL